MAKAQAWHRPFTPGAVRPTENGRLLPEPSDAGLGKSHGAVPLPLGLPRSPTKRPRRRSDLGVLSFADAEGVAHERKRSLGELTLSDLKQYGKPASVIAAAV